MSSSTLVAIPCTSRGFSTVPRPSHLGVCDCFLLAEVHGIEVVDVRLLAKPRHARASCRALVDMLASSGVGALVVSGVAGVPLASLRAAGIAVYCRARLSSLREAVESISSGEARLVRPRWIGSA